MKYINMSIVYWFYQIFIILEMKVALISYNLSKATSKAAENHGLMAWKAPTEPPAGSTPASVGHGQTRWWLPPKQQLAMVVGLTGSSPKELPCKFGE